MDIIGLENYIKYQYILISGENMHEFNAAFEC